MNKDLRQLRKSMDGSDPFMSGGHQIIITRKGRRRSVPDWAEDDAKLREILIRVFPSMMTNTRQRARAGTWARVAYLYYRANRTSSDIAEDTGMSVPVVERTIHKLKLAGEGLWANGRGKYGVRKRGRPKLNGVSNPTPSEVIEPRRGSDIPPVFSTVSDSSRTQGAPTAGEEMVHMPPRGDA